MIISLSSSPPLIMKLSVECVCMKSESVCVLFSCILYGCVHVCVAAHVLCASLRPLVAVIYLVTSEFRP